MGIFTILISPFHVAEMSKPIADKFDDGCNLQDHQHNGDFIFTWLQ
jgi:hypothetical protein